MAAPNALNIAVAEKTDRNHLARQALTIWASRRNQPLSTAHSKDNHDAQ
jgi:hypothetical protein